MNYRCPQCESKLVLPELVWEADDDPYISQYECLKCGAVTKLPKRTRKKEVEKILNRDVAQR